MSYQLLSRQCDSCYGTHKDILISAAKVAEPVRCPFCGGVMHTYELGRGFKTRPYKYRDDVLSTEQLAAA